MKDPNLSLLEAAARLLRPVLDELVFVGGSVAGLLITDPGSAGVRSTLADKLHNACAVLRDHRAFGEAVWERFDAPVGDQLWYYDSFVAVFRERAPGPMADELAEVVAEIKNCHEPAPRAGRA